VDHYDSSKQPPLNLVKFYMLKAKDSVVPIGCGQRELIIGTYNLEKQLYLLIVWYHVYVAIRRKKLWTVAQLVQILSEANALEYSINQTQKTLTLTHCHR